MRSTLPFAFVLITAFAVSNADGRDIFVDNLAGDDTFTGEWPRGESRVDRSGPVRSINKALRLARQGDRVVLAATKTPYRECISLTGGTHSGYSFRRFTIVGNGAVLDGSSPVPPDAWENHEGPVFRFRPPRQGYQQLFLNDRPAHRVPATGTAGGLPELEPLQWCFHEGYIYFRVEWKKLPEDYPLTYADKQTGITLFHVDRVLITNLTVQGFQLDGINAQNSARNILIHKVTCRGNGRAGVAVGGASLVELEDCGVGDNGGASLWTLPYSKTLIRDSVLLSNTSPAIVRRGGSVLVDGQPAPDEMFDSVPVESAEPSAP